MKLQKQYFKLKRVSKGVVDMKGRKNKNLNNIKVVDYIFRGGGYVAYTT